MAHVFISYNPVDSAFVGQFIKRLQGAFPDLEIWHDTSPNDLIGGDGWWVSILEAIAKSEIFIYILPKESVTSLYCVAEFIEARRLQKRIITIQARDHTETSEPLDDIQFIDMTDGVDDPDCLTRLYTVVNNQLKLAKAKRPLWWSTTPNPAKETSPTRTPMSSTVDAPSLTLTKKAWRWQIIGGIVGVLGLIIVVIALIPRGESTPPTPNATQTLESLARTPMPNNAAWKPVQRTFEDGTTMVLVPSGCFMMGENGDGGEQCFEPFWLDKFEVTEGQFAAGGGKRANTNYFIGDDLPVIMITWGEAREYCESRGGRLPTEAEWEFAARGPDELLYPWGNEFIAENLAHDGIISNQTSYVGSRPSGASWVGALDLASNVWEWTSSLYYPYPYNREDGRESVMASGVRVARGGSFLNPSDYSLLATYRYESASNDGFVGMRCVRSFVTE